MEIFDNATIEVVVVSIRRLINEYRINEYHPTNKLIVKKACCIF